MFNLLLFSYSLDCMRFDCIVLDCPHLQQRNDAFKNVYLNENIGVSSSKE